MPEQPEALPIDDTETVPSEAQVAPAEAPPVSAPSPIWRWLAVGLLVLGIALTVFFALHAVRSFRTFHAERGRPPHEATGDIAPWMTVPYIAAAYQVPADFLYTQLGIDAQGNERKSLMQIERTDFNGERGLLRDKILVALDLYYAGSVVPTPLAPDPASIPLPDAPPDGPHPGPPNDRNDSNDRTDPNDPNRQPPESPPAVTPAAPPANVGQQP